jgi:uncharacterized membrane protein YfcA
MSSELAAVFAILFLAALTKATLGFGESLLAIPLLTMVVGVQTAAPLVSLLAATVTLLLLVRNRQQIDLTATWRLLAAAVVGVPIGVWWLAALPATWVTAVLGGLLVTVGVYNLLQPQWIGLQDTKWTYLFGFLAGVLGGAYNIASPPVLIYGAVRRWPPEQFRVTMQGFFLPVSALILIGHAGAGLWTRQVLLLYALAWPIMLVAFWLGNHFAQRVKPQILGRLLYGALIVLGMALLVR